MAKTAQALAMIPLNVEMEQWHLEAMGATKAALTKIFGSANYSRLQLDQKYYPEKSDVLVPNESETVVKITLPLVKILGQRGVSATAFSHFVWDGFAFRFYKIEVEAQSVFPYMETPATFSAIFYETRWRSDGESFHLASPRAWAIKRRLNKILSKI